MISWLNLTGTGTTGLRYEIRYGRAGVFCRVLEGNRVATGRTFRSEQAAKLFAEEFEKTMSEKQASEPA